MRNETVQQIRKATDGQLTDIDTLVRQARPQDLSFDDAEAIGSRKRDFISAIQAVYADFSVEPTKKALADWQQFYKSEFGLNLNLTKLKVPPRPDRFNRLLVIAQGVTAERVYQKCASYFSCWKYTDRSLDEVVPTDERNPNKSGTYALWVRDEVEADEIHKNKSANRVASENLKTETLLERLLHELKYYKETGKHLDLSNWTLCSGSRISDGGVPRVDWGGDELSVFWYSPDGAHDDLRAREVSS